MTMPEVRNMETKMPKTFDELHTEIAHCVEALQHAMHDAQEQGCDLLLLIDATTNPGLAMPAVRIEHEGQAVWCGAWHLVNWNDKAGGNQGDPSFGLGRRRGTEKSIVQS
jgi:hypothetical protein